MKLFTFVNNKVVLFKKGKIKVTKYSLEDKNIYKIINKYIKKGYMFKM